MKTYPHATPDGIIALVEKSQYDAVVSELEQEVRDNTDLRQRSHEKSVEIARWQSVAEMLATALDDCNTKLVGWHGLYPSQVGSDDEATFQAGDKALAAYESAKKGEQP